MSAMDRLRTVDCDACGDEIVTQPDWADRHIHVEIRWSSGTGMTTGYFCSERCARAWLEGGETEDQSDV